MTSLEREEWRRLLAQLDQPPLGTVAEALADARDLEVLDAFDVAEEAIDAGTLAEEDVGRAFDVVRLAEDDETAETPKNAETKPEDGEKSGTTPTPDADKSGSAGAGPDREDAVDALRDVLRFYNARVDDTIDDHTEAGDHPERPTTAREYFTEVRGWDDDTVDDLLLGWAPPDHSDKLVAYLHDRGHDRDAILATGAVGETDTGGFYTTFQGRYVLPYYDADGEPAYAIARVTGGEGGGGRDYGGHPADYKAGKYAKLRHTDDRVPFDEPIYGLDTLEEGAHVVVAEGIADAITARELGYSVLSPVAKEFKEAHYDPLAEALEENYVDRMTIVADADGIRNGDSDELDPDTIGDAVGLALSQVGAGLGGALRTATKLDDRVDVDIRVTLPPAPADLESDLDEFVNGSWDGDLDALLASGKPAEAFDELDKVVSDGPAAGYDEFDAEEYEPTATGAGETTDDIRDVYAALDRLDAQRVAERTIVSEWIDERGGKRTFAPSWAPAGYTGTANFVDSDKWVDTGDRGGRGGPAVMAAIDAGLVRDNQCPEAVTGETWIKAVDHLRDLGFSIPELEDTRGGEEYDESARDLLDLDVVVEPGDAMRAARAVTVDDLDRPLPELERDDVDDVAIAVALADGVIDSPDVFPRDDGYTEAYYRARDVFGAPLPKYLDNSTLEERSDLVYAATKRVGPEHILDDIRSEVTVENPSGVAIAKIDPTWEDSDSGERILAGYGKGFWCAEHNVSFAPIQLVALEHELILNETEYPTGEAYKQAYRLLREEYDAPIPRWRATVLEEVTVLPPAVRVVDDELSATSSFDLDEARKETEALVRDALTTRDRAQLVTVVPGGGKTFSTAIAADDHPVLYAPPRNELKKQMEEYAREIRESADFEAEPTAYHLPILAENGLPDEAVEAAVAAVRGHGFDLLREREKLRERVVPHLEEEEGDDEPAADEDEQIDLDRATCPTAEGEHGEEWRIAVQTARSLGFRPSDIHRQAKTLFGDELPCTHDGDCQYTQGWDVVSDPARCPDILIGSAGHAFVDSATSYFTEGEDGRKVSNPRAVVIDEFPGDTYANDYGERFMDHATWLAEALTGVENREELLDADLNTDTWVAEWLEGNGEDVVEAAEAIDVLRAGAALADAAEAAEDLLDRDPIDLVGGATSANLRGLVDTLEALAGSAPGALDTEGATETVADVADQLETDAGRAYADRDDAAGPLYGMVETLRDRILDPLASAGDRLGGEPLADAIAERTADLPIGGDLRQLVDDATEAARGDAPAELLEAAVDALQGGRDGCRALALAANSGYAHPDAWALLAGAIAGPDDAGVSVGRQQTLSLGGDTEEGLHHKTLTLNGADIHADRDHHGAVVFDRPSFTDAAGSKCPVVGLDATARRDLWKIAIGRDAEVRDIHDTTAARRRHIREGMNHTVIQTANTPLPYHGDPSGRNFQEDLAVVEAAADEYGGLDDKPPAVISTLKVTNYLKTDLEDLAGETVNYEDMKGSDALGDHQVAVVLGSCHYGDTEPERWAMYAGESAGRGETSGETLDYGSDVANTYLKHMREDTTMQAILRAGRNDDRSVVVAHTSALREDLPVVAEGATVSAHSKGALAVAEAAAELNDRSFTAADVAERIRDDDRGVGLRQVQNILADLRSSGYLRVEAEGSRGREFEYGLEQDPGLADVELPDGEAVDAVDSKTKNELLDTYSWNFVLDAEDDLGEGMLPPSRPTIPAGDTAEAVADGVEPPS